MDTEGGKSVYLRLQKFSKIAHYQSTSFDLNFYVISKRVGRSDHNILIAL